MAASLSGWRSGRNRATSETGDAVDRAPQANAGGKEFGPYPDPNLIRHYTLDEICVIVTSNQWIDPCGDAAMRQYRAVAKSLGDAVIPLLPVARDQGDVEFAPMALDGLCGGFSGVANQAPDDAEREAFARYLGPDEAIWEQFRISAGGLLQPLTRWREPFVLLDHDDGCTTALNFYRVGLEPVNDPHPAAQAPVDGPKMLAFDNAQASTIRELVTAINFLSGQAAVGMISDQGWQISGATPNWLACAGQEGCGGHGPGTPPQLPDGAIPAASPATFVFMDNAHVTANQRRLQGLVDRQRRKAAGGNSSGVIVAILDQSPSKDQLTAAAPFPPVPSSFRFVHNTLLGAIANGPNPITMEGTLSLTETDFAPLKGYLPNLQGNLDKWYTILKDTTLTAHDRDVLLKTKRGDYYASADHGLFIAGIIKDIAPGADIHLIRVMDAAGMGDLFTIIGTMTAVPVRLRDLGDDRRIVINLSLTMEFPAPEERFAFWFPRATNSDAQAIVQRYWHEIENVLDMTEQSLIATLDYLCGKNVVVVAAAGNDAMGANAARPGPCLPARYPTVISVAATSREGESSFFSNRAEDPQGLNGIATFGGDAVRDNAAQINIIEPAIPTRERPDGIQGIFTAGTLPFNGGVNATGWVYWSGTSFSTPVITAIAANLLAEDSSLSVDMVMQTVQAFGEDPTDQALRCKVIFADQV